MKKLQSIILTTFISASIIAGCNESTENKLENGMDNLGNKVDSVVNKNADEDFLEDAVEANTMELKTLMVGKEKGGKDIAAHASHMIADHKKLGDEVMAYIQKKNINLTDVDTTETDNDLSNKAAGKDFDKAFADKMVSDHEKVIDLFEDAQDDVKDPELKEMITKALPTLKSHLEMSKEMQNKIK